MITSETIDRRTALARNVWLGLSRSWILGSSGGAVLLLLLCAIFVQQMPGQLHEDPTEAARWLLVASEQYGLLGNVLRALGLFNVLHNPLLQLLLMVIALVLLIHLGNVIAAAWRLYRVTTWLHSPVPQPGEPVALAPVQPIYRLRQAVDSECEQVVAQLQAELAKGFPAPQRADLILTTVPAVNTFDASTAETQPETDRTVATSATPTAQEEHAPVPEIRLLALRHLPYALLRPLLLIGLFIALVTVWLILIAGWEVTPPMLAPGDQYNNAAQNLTISYAVTDLDETNKPPLRVQVGEAKQQLALNSTLRTNWWQLAIRNASGPPALLLQTEDKAPLLSQPGQPQALPQIGLIFPSVGSEEFVVVDQSLVLRLVRLLGTSEQPGITAFWVEVYQVDADEPVLRLEVADRTSEVLTLNGKSYTLAFVPLPSAMLDVRYQPGVWLLGLALLLVLIGGVGYWQRPAFVFAQIAPWPTERTVLVLQSDLAVEMQALRAWLTQQQRLPNEST